MRRGGYYSRWGQIMSKCGTWSAHVFQNRLLLHSVSIWQVLHLYVVYNLINIYSFCTYFLSPYILSRWTYSLGNDLTNVQFMFSPLFLVVQGASSTINILTSYSLQPLHKQLPWTSLHVSSSRLKILWLRRISHQHHNEQPQGQGSTNSGRQFAMTTKLSMVMPKFVSSAWNLHHVTLLEPAILRRLTDFWKICAPLQYALLS